MSWTNSASVTASGANASAPVMQRLAAQAAEAARGARAARRSPTTVAIPSGGEDRERDDRALEVVDREHGARDEHRAAEREGDAADEGGAAHGRNR